jgi:hypothetical protein
LGNSLDSPGGVDVHALLYAGSSNRHLALPTRMETP